MNVPLKINKQQAFSQDVHRNGPKNHTASEFKCLVKKIDQHKGISATKFKFRNLNQNKKFFNSEQCMHLTKAEDEDIKMRVREQCTQPTLQ